MKRSGMLSYFLCGLIITTVGAVLPSLLAHYALSYTQGGQLVFVGSAGFLLGVPLSSLLLRWVSERRLLTVASLLMAVAQLGLLALPPFGLVMALHFITSLGAAAMETVVATLMMEVFVRRRAVVMSHLEVAFGLGGLAMPAVASVLIASGVWSYAFLLTSAMAVLIALVWHKTVIRQEDENEGGAADASTPPPAGMTAGMRVLLVCLFAFLIFLYSGMEGSLNNFLPSLFLAKLDVLPYAASLSVSAFWVAMVFGRLLTGWIIRTVTYGSFLMWSMAGVVLGLAAFVLTAHAAAGYAVVALLGLMMSGIYSITMVYANHSFPGMARFITGLITAVAGIGGALSPALVGYLMDQAGPEWAIWMLAGFAVLFLAALAVVFRLYRDMTARPLQSENSTGVTP